MKTRTIYLKVIYNTKQLAESATENITSIINTLSLISRTAKKAKRHKKSKYTSIEKEVSLKYPQITQNIETFFKEKLHIDKQDITLSQIIEYTSVIPDNEPLNPLELTLTGSLISFNTEVEIESNWELLEDLITEITSPQTIRTLDLCEIDPYDLF